MGVAMVDMAREVGRFEVDVRDGGRPPSINITDHQSNVEISGLLIEDVTDLIYALRRAQLEMVAMLAEVTQSSASPDA
jgi:hypothetical protein